MGELRDYPKDIASLPQLPKLEEMDEEALTTYAQERDLEAFKPRTKKMRKKELASAKEQDDVLSPVERFVKKERVLAQVDAEIIPDVQFEHLHGFWPEIMEALEREIDTEARAQLEGLLQWVQHRFGKERKKRLEGVKEIILQEKERVFKEVVDEARTYPKVVQQMMMKDAGVDASGKENAHTNELQRMTYRKFRTLLEKEGYLRPASVVADGLSGDEEAALRHLLGSARVEQLKEQPWRLQQEEVQAIMDARKRIDAASQEEENDRRAA